MFRLDLPGLGDDALPRISAPCLANRRHRVMVASR